MSDELGNPLDSPAQQAYSVSKEAGKKIVYERRASIRKEKKKPEKENDKVKAEDKSKAGVKAAKEKSSAGVGPLIALLAVMLVTIALAFGMYLTFTLDLGGVRTLFGQTVLQYDDFYIKQMALLNSRIAEYDNLVSTEKEKITIADTRLTDLTAAEKKLNKRSADLDKKEQKLLAREASVTVQEQQQSQLVATFTKLDPTAAAKMLESMGDKYGAVKILAQMDVKRCATIMEAMSPEYSAEIAQLMLNPSYKADASENEISVLDVNP